MNIFCTSSHEADLGRVKGHLAEGYYISHISYCLSKISNASNLKKERFNLVHGFGEFCPWKVDTKAVTVWYSGMAQEDYLLPGSQEGERKRGGDENLLLPCSALSNSPFLTRV